MPGIIPEHNPDLDFLVNYDPSKNPLGGTMLKVTDTDLDDEDEEFAEVVLDATTALQNARLSKQVVEQQKKIEEEQRQKALDALE